MTSEAMDPGRPPEGGGAGQGSFDPETGTAAKTRRVAVKMDGPEDLERLARATGTDDPYLRDRMINDVLGCLALAGGADAGDAEIAVRAALAALEAIGPGDAAEGMLAAQMVGCHAAAMECLKRAMRGDGPAAARDWNLRHATRLMALYERQLAALDRRREARRERETTAYFMGKPGGDPRPTASATRPRYRNDFVQRVGEIGTTEDTACLREAEASLRRRQEDTEVAEAVKTAGVPEDGTPPTGKPVNGARLKDALLSGTHLGGTKPGG